MLPTDTTGFQATVAEVIAGDTAAGFARFVLPSDQVVSNGRVTWTLVDSTGAMYGSGNALNYAISSSSFMKTVTAEASIPVPSSMPPSSTGRAYQIRWTLFCDEFSVPPILFEPLRVVPLIDDPTGPSTSLELEGDVMELRNILDAQFSEVFLDIFQGNLKVAAGLVPAAAVRVANGYLYTVTLDPATAQFNLAATLDPLMLSWRFRASPTSTWKRETGRVFVVNPTILSAVEDVRAMVARSVTVGLDDLIFKDDDIVTFLRRGRDLFNGAGGIPTSFTMLGATSTIREMWIRYAEVGLLRAQALAEGEKAFDFSGQAISLNVDKSQHYQTLADNLQGQLDNEAKPLKMGLAKKGLTSGSGDMAQMNQFSTARVGISITPASQIGRGFYNRY